MGLGLSGISPGCCSVGSACTVDYSSGSSAADVAVFSPVSRFSALVWDFCSFIGFLLLFLGYAFGVAIFAPSVCSPLLSLLQLLDLCCFSCGPPSLVVPVDVCSVSFFLSVAAELCLVPLILLGVG